MVDRGRADAASGRQPRAANQAANAGGRPLCVVEDAGRSATHGVHASCRGNCVERRFCMTPTTFETIRTALQPRTHVMKRNACRTAFRSLFTDQRLRLCRSRMTQGFVVGVLPASVTSWSHDEMAFKKTVLSGYGCPYARCDDRRDRNACGRRAMARRWVPRRLRRRLWRRCDRRGRARRAWLSARLPVALRAMAMAMAMVTATVIRPMRSSRLRPCWLWWRISRLQPQRTGVQCTAPGCSRPIWQPPRLSSCAAFATKPLTATLCLWAPPSEKRGLF